MLEGLTYQFVYNLERHRLFNVRLRRWLVLLCFVLPAALWLGRASRVSAAIATLVAVALLVAIWRSERQRYVRFVASSPNTPGPLSDPSSQPESPLPPMSKVRVRATGRFEVSGMQRYFVETPADYTTFETGEHCVMTQIPRSRFLLLGTSNPREVGWWYTFFQPWMIRSVTRGRLYFGLHPRSALQLRLSADNQEEVLYLSFDDEKTRSLVLADLQHNAG